MMNKILVSTLILVSSFWESSANIPRLDHKIVGGRNASMADYPYQVSIRRYNGHICGGSIFLDSFILTAAHCVHGDLASRFSIRAGSRFINKGGQIIKVCSMYDHENYNVDTLDNDIAILKLCSPLKFSDRILPIALPEIGENVADSTRALVSGWGYERENGRLPSVLKQVEIPLIPHRQCQTIYSQFNNITNNMICAGVIQSGGKDACQGDSGGPLRAKGKQMGIVSWGFGCARPNYPGVYTKISNYRSWIKRITNY